MTRREPDTLWDQPLDHVRPYSFVSDAADHVTDLRIRQLRLRVHPPIPWGQVIMVAVAVFIGVILATGGVL